MTFDDWLFGLGSLLAAGELVSMLVRGRTRVGGTHASRREDPFRYWTWFGCFLLLFVLCFSSLWRSLAGDPNARVAGAHFWLPLFLATLVDGLRSGSVQSLGKEPYLRAERPAVYWGHILFMSLMVALGAWLLFASWNGRP